MLLFINISVKRNCRDNITVPLSWQQYRAFDTTQKDLEEKKIFLAFTDMRKAFDKVPIEDFIKNGWGEGE